MKECRDCKVVKPYEEFHKGSSKGGRNSYCKECGRARARSHYHATKDARIAKMAEWRQANPTYGKKYRSENRDKIREKDQRWDRENREARNAITRRRQARLRNALVPGMAEPDTNVLVRFYGKACLFPGCTATVAEPDHVQALARGGKHTYANTQPLCRSHNGSKSDRHSTDYRPLANKGNGKEGIILTNITRIAA